jgi:anti-sigma B factor antagonist
MYVPANLLRYGRLRALNGAGGRLKDERALSTDNLEIAVDHVAEGVLVHLHGRLGIDSSPDLRAQLLITLKNDAPETVIVDLTEVSYIDTSGVATLLESLKIARSQHTTLCLKGLQGRVVRLFEATGLIHLFEADGCKVLRRS